MKSLIFLLFFLPYFACDEYSQYGNFYMPLAAAAYSDNPNICWSNVMKSNYRNKTMNVSIYRQYTAKCDSLNGTCYGYIAVDNYQGFGAYIHVVFRGTNNNYAFLENGWNYNEMVPFVAGGKVSKVFFDGFNSLWNAGMKDDLLTLKNKYLDAEFYFIGHSIGGAMASLAAGTFQTLDIDLNIGLVTFGQPRTGDIDFANNMHLYSEPERVIHKADMVPHLPPLKSSSYYHHSQELWYNNDMGAHDKPVLCDLYEGEDSKCSNSLSKNNMDDHKTYFGRNFIEYGKNGCPGLAPSKYMNTRARIPEKRSKP